MVEYYFLYFIDNLINNNIIDELFKSDDNYLIIKTLFDNGLCKLLTSVKLYHLYVIAISYKSFKLSSLLLDYKINKTLLKEFLINFLCSSYDNDDFTFFKEIWDKKDKLFNKNNFTKEELLLCLTNIINSGNCDFLDWFITTNNFTINELELIRLNIILFLENIYYFEDFIIAIYLSNFYYKNKNSNTYLISM